MSQAESPPFHIVVFSCGDLGWTVANRLLQVRGVSRVSLITTPYKRKKLTFWGKVKHVHRTQGWPGLLSVAADKVLRRSEPNGASSPATALDPAITHLRFQDFHQSECLDKLRELKPDLGVIAGTYILKESVFAAPRLGSINLHTGKVPEYRGAAPAFWEMHNGETEVGITIHRVLAAVDAGAILKQEVFPLDNAPADEPLAYIERYRREVLLPNGVRMLTEVVGRIVDGTVQETPQDTGKAKTYKTPNYEDICELRRRVGQRRKQGQNA